MIDANANRAAEAARTLEDLARFVLDRADLSALFKTIRHDLAQGLEQAGWSLAERASLRDTRGDPGTEITTPREQTRPDLASIAGAASGRLGEALRCIEELVKLESPEHAAAIQRARYRGYDAAADVIAGLTKPGSQWRLCVLITESLCAVRPWYEVAEAAIAGGADCMQLREKSLTDLELLHRAERLVDLARPRGCAVMINDRPDVAALVDADGVHLGQDDLPCAHAREVVGRNRLVGVSCSTSEQARRAVAAGADVLGLGPIFPSTTKPKPIDAGPELLKAVLTDPVTSRMPHLAISGIGPEQARQLAALGCRGVAVASAVTQAKDPCRTAKEIADALAYTKTPLHADETA